MDVPVIEDTLREASYSKTMSMERSVARLRAIVIGFNVVAWFIALGPGSPRAPLAMLVIAVAVPYAIWSVGFHPYERHPLLRFGATTLVADATLIGVWMIATGGAQSPFWAVTIVSVISVAMRYDLWQTVAAGAGEGALVFAITLIDGDADLLSAMVHPTYVMIAGLAAGLLARQERISREERVAADSVADMRARLLETERETVERLRGLDRMKSDFIAHAAHELRTPLTSLSGLATTLATRTNELEPSQLESILEGMGRQGERTRMLIDNLLDLSQLDNGSVDLAPSPASIGSLVREALDLNPPPDGKDVEVDLMTDGPILVDRRRFSQVLTNLLTNAYRYGGPRVRVSSSVRGRTIEISVRDDGPGVPSELVPSLFQPFRRGPNVGETIGTGLGLAISHRLVDALGGELTYRADEPGARFSITVPTPSGPQR